MDRHAVVIAGGGPTGLMLAAELALARVDVVIVERRAAADPDRSRAGGLHARTIEVLDQRGVADRFVGEGKAMQIQGFGRIRLDIRVARRVVRGRTRDTVPGQAFGDGEDAAAARNSAKIR